MMKLLSLLSLWHENYNDDDNSDSNKSDPE